MYRQGKVVFLSHCILNQNSVVKPLARAKGGYNKIVEEIIKRDIGIYQIMCPENKYLGLDRLPKTKEEYDNEDYRDICKGIAYEVVTDIEKYINNSNKVLGIIGISESPTCSYNKNKGILFEEIFYLLNKKSIYIPVLNVSTNYVEEKENKKLIDELIEFLDNNKK
ncbi:CD3072 family TudS-related putative desulfidase [Tepidibacter aestuarii]|uniref:CD3072 family TudS-related putative desulfidase n=1 Tax=Tepidibacter aestuarii TaxID=2925782 RepID=UPI0020BF6BA7|nr:CD3072 family TudS-related putative desulfidase [Tepidibacter aestuarii]CAH2212490.1 putative secreted protein [Tepidibacter aestuarii]